MSEVVAFLRGGLLEVLPGVPMSFTIGHGCEFEDGVQGTLQVRQVVWKQRHESRA